MSGTSSSFGQLYWMFWRVREMAVVAVVLAREVREHAQLAAWTAARKGIATRSIGAWRWM